MQVSSDCKCDERLSGEEASNILSLNHELKSIVTLYKNKINEYYQSKLWDRFKKVSNEYESIFTSSHTHNIATYIPVSRSFFKLWEVLHDFETDILKEHPMRVMFLAEGPGGFMEAFIHKRLPKHHDTVYGITLKSNNNKNIPDWKYSNENITICYGKDGTGNLYNVENIKHLGKTLGENTIDFITADGGFDFSSDFNSQEELSLHLILSEVLASFILQSQGGTFFIKVYDCFNLPTVRILTILFETYGTLYFVKPLTSRPANSERYILCCGFKGPDDEKVIMYKTMLQNILEAYTSKPYDDILKNVQLNPIFVQYLLQYNLYYTVRQVYYIQRTINYINKYRSNTCDEELNALVECHVEKSKKWCHKYNIPYK